MSFMSVSASRPHEQRGHVTAVIGKVLILKVEFNIFPARCCWHCFQTSVDIALHLFIIPVEYVCSSAFTTIVNMSHIALILASPLFCRWRGSWIFHTNSQCAALGLSKEQEFNWGKLLQSRCCPCRLPSSTQEKNMVQLGRIFHGPGLLWFVCDFLMNVKSCHLLIINGRWHQKWRIVRVTVTPMEHDL